MEALPYTLNLLAHQSLGLALGWAFWQGASEMPLWIRIAFLIALIVTGIVYLIVAGPPPLPFGSTLGTNLVVVGGLVTFILFIVILFRLNPFPYIRNAAEWLGLRQVVNFDTALQDGLPDALAANIGVVSVERADTDADGFEEWVVFYMFDKRASSSPIMGAVYDNDRGNPPVIFPYQLRAPDRNYLSEQQTFGPTLTIRELALDRNGANGASVPEVIVQGGNELTIFRFKQNSTAWDFPRDAPPRYQPIGFFRGSSVSLDQQTRQVTVIDRNGRERSQLALRAVYDLRVDPVTNEETYLDPIPPLGDVGSPRLAAPTISTIDFYPSPPGDIFNTPYPEKIVLGFYATTCAAKNKTLCNSFNANWDPRNFLAGDALTAFDRGDGAYFGLPGVRGIARISVSQLRYYPQTETDPDLLETGQGRDVVTGEEGQVGLVEISFTVNDSSELRTRRYEVRRVAGQWKILRISPPPSVVVCPIKPNAEIQPDRVTVNFSVEPTDPAGSPLRLANSRWDFGDGQSSSGESLSHIYTPPLPGSATFTADVIQGLPIKCEVPLEIRGLISPPPTAVPNGPYSALVCQPITLSSAGSSGNITSYQWNFGDGAPLANDPNPTHVYTKPGDFTITLTVTDNNNQSSQATTTVKVGIPAPPPPSCPPAPCCG